MNLTGFFYLHIIQDFLLKTQPKTICHYVLYIYDRPTFTHRTSLLSFDVTSRLHITIIIASIKNSHDVKVMQMFDLIIVKYIYLV